MALSPKAAFKICSIKNKRLFHRIDCSIPLLKSNDMEQLLYSSVENLPHARASAAFTEPKPVFKENGEVTPTILSDTHAYMPWGATNQMPFDIIDLIESDETLATCQMFNAEVCYGSGLVYDTAQAAEAVKGDVEDFLLDNDLASYFLGVCQDLQSTLLSPCR